MSDDTADDPDAVEGAILDSDGNAILDSNGGTILDSDS